MLSFTMALALLPFWPQQVIKPTTNEDTVVVNVFIHHSVKAATIFLPDRYSRISKTAFQPPNGKYTLEIPQLTSTPLSTIKTRFAEQTGIPIELLHYFTPYPYYIESHWPRLPDEITVGQIFAFVPLWERKHGSLDIVLVTSAAGILEMTGSAFLPHTEETRLWRRCIDEDEDRAHLPSNMGPFLDTIALKYGHGELLLWMKRMRHCVTALRYLGNAISNGREDDADLQRELQDYTREEKLLVRDLIRYFSDWNMLIENTTEATVANAYSSGDIEAYLENCYMKLKQSRDGLVNAYFRSQKILEDNSVINGGGQGIIEDSQTTEAQGSEKLIPSTATF